MRSALAIAALAAAVAASSALGAGAASSGCPQGLIDYGGAKARVYCGPAKATVRLGTSVFKVVGGMCNRTATTILVNVGTIVIGKTTKPYPSYFGINVGPVPDTSLAKAKPAPRDGTYRGGIISISYRGKGYFARGDGVVTTLSSGRTKGTFTAKTIDGKPVSGSFTC